MSSALPFRLARAAVFAVACAGLSMAAHASAGGPLCALGVAGGLGMSFTAAFALAGRERSLRVILPLLAVLQVALHLQFSLMHAAMAPAQHVAHAHAGLVPGLGMVIAHGWAVVLTALWLARGEALLWGVLRRLGVRLSWLLVRWATPASPARPPTPAPEPLVLRPALLRHLVIRRGPPPLAAAAARRPAV
jgi:hypothetical protein